MQEANIFENRPPKDIKVALRTILGTLQAFKTPRNGPQIYFGKGKFLLQFLPKVKFFEK